MKTIYSPNPILTLSPDVEIIIDVPETKEVTFTMVTSKKSKKRPKCLLSLLLTLRLRVHLFQEILLLSRV